jgi:Recombination enhancement, RecA-dependent nuclease
MTTKQKKQHYDNIANLGCILCIHLGHNGTPAEVHHIRRFGGKRDLAPVIPLCPEHHRGNTGVHGMGKKSFARHYGVDEHDLLEKVNELLDT